ncbi:MAG: hypothetical protein IJF42_06450 [Clostridia bacterium]|nr:hypothetical protein [Clostridia bacterium]
MLKWFDSDNEVESIPRSRLKFYLEGKSKLSDEEYRGVCDYINVIIDSTQNADKQFLVPGWKVPGSWEHTPLDIIWKKVFPGDAVSCAKWYGLLVMHNIINREETWNATKTNFAREFDQMVYWRHSDAGLQSYTEKASAKKAVTSML